MNGTWEGSVSVFSTPTTSASVSLQAVDQPVLERVLRRLLVALQLVAVADEDDRVEPAVLAARASRRARGAAGRRARRPDEATPDPAPEPLEVLVVAVEAPQLRVLELTGEAPSGSGDAITETRSMFAPAGSIASSIERM